LKSFSSNKQKNKEKKEKSEATTIDIQSLVSVDVVAKAIGSVASHK